MREIRENLIAREFASGGTAAAVWWYIVGCLVLHNGETNFELCQRVNVGLIYALHDAPSADADSAHVNLIIKFISRFSIIYIHAVSSIYMELLYWQERNENISVRKAN